MRIKRDVTWFTTAVLLLLVGCAGGAVTTGAQAGPSAQPTAVDVPPINPAIFDRDAYSLLDRDDVDTLRAAAEAKADWKPILTGEFTFQKIERYECGGAAHWMAIYRHAKTGLDFALIPGGTYSMGSPSNAADRDDATYWDLSDEWTQHQVTLSKPFLMCVTECTQAAWKNVSGGENPSSWKGNNLPVEEVSWTDANDSCLKAGLSLPTEAQWEYACRAGTTTEFCGGDADSTRDALGWYGSNSGDQTHPVGQKKANAFGLYDVHGNVWEWCGDWYTDDLGAGAVRDPEGPATGSDRVVRGGSWYLDASFCVAAIRIDRDPSLRGSTLGFRPSRPLP